MDFGREQLTIIEEKFGSAGKFVSALLVYVVVGAVICASVGAMLTGVKYAVVAITDVWDVLFTQADPATVGKGFLNLAIVAAVVYSLWRYVLSPAKRREDKRISAKVQAALEDHARILAFIEALSGVLAKHQNEIPDWLRNADFGPPLIPRNPDTDEPKKD